MPRYSAQSYGRESMIKAETTTTEKEVEKVGGSLRNGPDSGDRHRPSQRRPSLGRDRGEEIVEGRDHFVVGAHSLVFSLLSHGGASLIARAKNGVYDSK